MASNNGWFKLTKSRLKTIKNDIYILDGEELIEINTCEGIAGYADYPNFKVTASLEELIGSWLFRVPDRVSSIKHT